MKLSPNSFSSLMRYSYKEKGLYFLCIDNAQFMNHSLEQANIVQEKETNIMSVKRNIAKGEELFCDYFSYSDHDDVYIMQLCKQK